MMVFMICRVHMVLDVRSELHGKEILASLKTTYGENSRLKEE